MFIVPTKLKYKQFACYDGKNDGWYSESTATNQTRNNRFMVWHSQLHLGFKVRHQQTQLVHRQHKGALLVQRAFHPEPKAQPKTATVIPQVQDQSGICHVLVLYPPAGIALGDQLDIHLQVSANSQAVLTTPGAGKWYGTAAKTHQAQTHVLKPSCQSVDACVEAGAWLEWLPQESIVFDHAQVEAHNRFELDSTAGLMTWDIAVFGRHAYAEHFLQGHYSNRLEITRAGQPLVFECIDQAANARWFKSPLGLKGQRVLGTFWVVPPLGVLDALNQGTSQVCVIKGLRSFIQAKQLPVVCSQTKDAISIRYLGNQVRDCFDAFAAVRLHLRQVWHGWQPHTPRIWHT